MMEQFVSLDFISTVSLKADFFAQAIDAYLSGAGDIKIVSLILMMLALLLFLFLIIIIYIRNIIFFVKSNNPQKNIEDEDDKLINLFNEDEQLELEKELQKELDRALAERREKEKQAEEQEKQNKEKEQEKERDKKEKNEQKKQKKEAALTKNAQENHKRIKEPVIDLDWKKGRIPPADLVSLPTEGVSLSYQQNRRELNQLLGLVIDMLGRGVDDLKIAQTVNYKTQGITDENEILKIIDAVKQFISICVSGKFVHLEKYASLPGEEQALYHLANGDPSLALALLEQLMDENIDKANVSASEEKRQRLYDDVSGYACCFGSLAEINDIMLATSAYELAIELRSVNVVAWSRLGDVYKKANSTSKSVWAYQNVLNFADGEIDIAEIANANKSLSEHLYAEGNSLQAAKLYNSAKQYYDSLGINRRLDKQELEIIEIIENNSKASLPDTIRKLLSEQGKKRS